MSFLWQKLLTHQWIIYWWNISPYLFSNRINTEYDCMIIDGETLGEGDLIMAAAKETVQN